MLCQKEQGLWNELEPASNPQNLALTFLNYVTACSKLLLLFEFQFSNLVKWA